MSQERQQAVLRGMRSGEMLPQQYQQLMLSRQNGMNINSNELRHKAIANNRNAYVIIVTLLVTLSKLFK